MEEHNPVHAPIPSLGRSQLERMIDMGIGVLISLLVNCEFSRKRVETWMHMKNGKIAESGTGETSSTDEDKIPSIRQLTRYDH